MVKNTPKINQILIKQILKFIFIGLINTFIDFFVLNIEMLITGITSGIYMIILNSISFLCALINSYFLNKNWTFYDNDNKKQDKKFIHFFLVSLFSIIINNIIVYFITTFTTPIFSISTQLWANGAKFIATFFSLFCNFIGYKYLVFNQSK